MSDNIDVIIYKPTKSAMQSGLATNKFWILKYISYSKTIKPKSYADNFSFKRKGLWSH